MVSTTKPIDAARVAGTPPPSAPSDLFCGTRTNAGSIQTSGVLLSTFASNVSPFTGRIVIDRTGLTGPFDLDLKYSPGSGVGTGDPASDLPSLFVAIQEQLGMKLEAVRAPVDVLVIDSAQRATDN